MRRSTPRPTGLRSTPSRCRASSTATRTRRAAPSASPSRSRRRCAASSSCRTSWRSAPPRKGRIKAFALEPEVSINNQWSNRYTVVEVTGLDRPGLLYELTATLSKLNLNIASAHVATFGERVVDVFYVTDLHRRADHLADAPGRDQARAAAAVCRGRAQGREGGVMLVVVPSPWNEVAPASDHGRSLSRISLRSIRATGLQRSAFDPAISIFASRPALPVLSTNRTRSAMNLANGLISPSTLALSSVLR